jgi:hypothetical protein
VTWGANSGVIIELSIGFAKQSTVGVTQVTSKVLGTTRLKDVGDTVSLCASGLCVPATVCKFIAVIATVYEF